MTAKWVVTKTLRSILWIMYSDILGVYLMLSIYRRTVYRYCHCHKYWTMTSWPWLHWVPLTMSSVTTSTRLQQANNLVSHWHYLIDHNIKKFSYNKHRDITSTFLCIKVLVVSGTQCITYLKFDNNMSGLQMLPNSTPLLLTDIQHYWTRSYGPESRTMVFLQPKTHSWQCLDDGGTWFSGYFFEFG